MDGLQGALKSPVRLLPEQPNSMGRIRRLQDDLIVSGGFIVDFTGPGSRTFSRCLRVAKQGQQRHRLHIITKKGIAPHQR